MTEEQKKILNDEAELYETNYYKAPELILEVADHWRHGCLAGYNSRDEEIEKLREVISSAKGFISAYLFDENSNVKDSAREIHVAIVNILHPK